MRRIGQFRIDRSRFALLAGLGIDNFGSGMFLPLPVVYATRVLNLNVATAGVTVGVATALGLAVPPLAGRMTSRIGPQRTVVTAQLVQGAGAVTYLLARDVIGAFTAAGLMAIGAQLFYCSVFVLIADMSTNEAKERPFALVGMIRSGAFGAGALTAALALARDSEAALRWLVSVDAGTFGVAALVLALFVRTDPVASGGAVRAGPMTVFRDRSYLTLMTAVCLLNLTIDFALVGTPVFILHIIDGPVWLPGVLLAAGTALSSVAGVSVVNALAGYRRTRSLQLGALACAAFNLLFLAALWVPRSWLVPYASAAWLLFVAASKILYPIAGALSEALPPREARGGYMATYQYSFTTAQILAPLIVALFAVRAWLPWATVTVSALLALPLLRRLSQAMPAQHNRTRTPATTI